MKAITTVTIDYSDSPGTTVQVDFFENEHGVVVYDLSIHSFGGYMESRMVVPLVDVLSLMNYLAGGLPVWEADTLEAKIAEWKDARGKTMFEPAAE